MRLPSIAAVALALAACTSPENHAGPDAGVAADAFVFCDCPLGEVCDPSGACTKCGNGWVDTGELCDPKLAATKDCGSLGYQPGQVGCTASCEWALDQCMPLATCNNGQLDTGELCDGTAIKTGLDCADYGRTEGQLACAAGCAIDTSDCHTCGDGNREADEACDDNDKSSGDGCSNVCAIETGFQCSTGSPSVCTPICGDGKIRGAETCDDGNTTAQDGCNASCRVEADCTCSGTPSQCACAWVQTITTLTGFPYMNEGDITLDANGKPRIVYTYDGDEFYDAMGNYREPAYLVYGERGTSSWSTSQVQTWNQSVVGSSPDDLELAFDGGTLRTYYQRYYVSGASFAIASRSGTSWSFAYDAPYYTRDVVRAGGAWHTLVDAPSFANLRYRMGAPGAWTRDEAITGVNVNDDPRLDVASNGDVYMATVTRGTSNGTYRARLRRRVDATSAWADIVDVTTTAPVVASTCIYPIFVEPLALAAGNVMLFEQGFDKTKARWLRAHVKVNGTWIVEDVANLSWLDSSCTTSSASWSNPRMVTATDALGQPHILYASQPAAGTQTTTTVEDHYRDATGWKVRTFPVTNAAPLDMVIDGQGNTHLLAMTSSNGTTRLSYVRIDVTAW